MPDHDPASPPEGDGVETRIQLVEETATISKREVVTGKVVVRTVVDAEERVLSEALSENTVSVERVAVDRVVEAIPPVRTEGNVTIIPVLQERIVVQKQLVLLEEVRITRLTSVETVDIPVQLKTQRAIVERT